jgi:hypothetical protein
MKTCENCRNKYSGYVCKQTEIEISKRIPCEKFKEYPKGITPRELIKLLETMPQDREIRVETDGLFAITGAYIEDESIYIYLKADLICW